MALEKGGVDFIPDETDFDLSLLDPPMMTGGGSKVKTANKVDNIFDISANRFADANSGYDMKELLKGYDEIPRAKWEEIEPNTHVRYLRKDGKFRKGGYVVSVSKVSSGRYKGSTTMTLRHSFGNGKTWNLPCDNVKKIWAKEHHGASANGVPSKDLADMKSTLEYLKGKVDSIEVTQQQQANEQSRIVNLIKKLHGISRGS